MKEKLPTNRGDQTREALLSAALQIFGDVGFDAASNRRIADAAGVNQALIGYHFGSKQGLYLAVFESIAERMATHMMPVAARLLERLEGVDGSTPDRLEISVGCLETLLAAALGLFGEGVEKGWIRLVIHEQQKPTRAFEILWDGMMGRMLELLSRLIGLARDQDPRAESTRLQAMMLIGQLLVFVTARSTTARHMGWDHIGPAQLSAIKEQMLVNVRAQFGGEIAS